jgi:3',5'-cyclic AMP phosphodiesterase CpdA
MLTPIFFLKGAKAKSHMSKLLRIVLPLSFLLVGLAESVALTRHPYIQNTYPDKVTIVWKTDLTSDSMVEYGLTRSYGNVVHNKLAKENVHIVTLTDLVSGTRYYYRVSSDGNVLTSGDPFFQTNKSEADPSFTFVVFGDSGTASQAQLDVAKLIEKLSPDLLLHTGDVIYPAGAAKDYDPKFFQPYQNTLKRVPIYPCLGNHDLYTNNGHAYLDAFILPGEESGSASERYYSFDYANAHFICLDVETTHFPQKDDYKNSAQYRWLVKDLETKDKTWTFVFFHKPVYSSAMSDDRSREIDLQHKLSPLFEKYQVDLVFSGHNHNYERTKPIKEGRVSKEGITYVITGGGGAVLDTPENYGNSPLSARLEFAYHVTKVSINGDSLLLEAIRPNGEVFDSYSISKSSGLGFSDVYRMLGNPPTAAILVIIFLFIIVVVRRELSKKRR